MIEHVFFDLDGTLTDSAEGITSCLAHALAGLGHPVPEPETLRRQIGTPLTEIFRRITGRAEPEHLERARDLYVARFRERGWRENRVYDGVPEMLGALADRRLRLHICTSKGGRDATRIARHFALSPPIESVFGPESDEERADKAPLLRRALRELGADPARCLMVGDRHHDMRAARIAGTRALGVVWGYGSPSELRESGAEQHCAHPSEIPASPFFASTPPGVR